MRFIILTFFSIFCFSLQAQEQGISDDVRLSESVEAITAGRALFNNHCGICHAITHEIVGPSLASSPQKRPLSWLIRFIRNSQQIIGEGDEYAVELYNNYNKLLMPPFDFLSDQEILSILAYIQDESVADGVQAESQVEPFGRAVKIKSGMTPDNFSRSLAMKSYQTDMSVPLYLSVLYIALIVTLVMLVWLGIRIFKNTH